MTNGDDALMATLGSHLRPGHPDLAARVADITRRTESLRRHSDSRRRGAG